MRKVWSGYCPNNAGKAHIDKPKSDKARIKELERVVNLVAIHKDSFELIDAIKQCREALGRETYYI